MLSIQDEQDSLPELAEALRSRAVSLMKALDLEDTEVSVLLCDDDAIQALNAQWRGIDKPTDVLSFPMGEDDILGDIVISVDTTIRQAEEYAHTPLDEATRLWIHGLLHLCGYDHETPEEAAEMRAKEEELLAMLGREEVTPLVYAADESE